MNPMQRTQRIMIRNAYLDASIKTMEEGKRTQDAFGRSVLDAMIAECRKHGVDNYGDTPA